MSSAEPSTDGAAPTLAAIVLTGGAGRRLGGLAKADLVIGGESLLDRALRAVGAATQVTVVGEERATKRPVRWCRESPAGGGPAAGVLAGLAELAAELVVVLAVDMPLVTDRTVARLLAAAGGHDGAALVDEQGYRQPLCAVYRVDALRAAGAAYAGRSAGLPMRTLIASLALAEVAATGEESLDVDTAEGLASVRANLLRSGR